MKKILTEFLATLLMLMVITETAFRFRDPSVALFAASLGAGLAVTVLIYVFGAVSGAHMNPAVTLTFAWRKDLSWKLASGYVVAQLLGAVTGSWLIFTSHAEPSMQGITVPSDGWIISSVLEFFLTLFLMFCILFFADARRPALNRWTGIAVGVVVFLEIWFAGEHSGASMNPARSFGPSLVSGDGQHLFNLLLYFLAPITGAWVGNWLYRRIFA